MEILALTPYEALGTYTGLEIQQLIRSGLWFVPALLIIAMSYMIFLDMKTASVPEKTLALIKYNIISLLLIGALWPEAMGVKPSTLSATAVKSGIAVEQGGPQQNAAIMGQGKIQPTIAAPSVTQVMISALTQMSFNLGKLLDKAATRPASFVMPMNWLLRQKLDHQDRIKTQEWAQECVAEAYLVLQQQGVNLTYAQSMPFPGTPTFAQLSTMEEPIGRALLNLVVEKANCGAVGQQIEASVIAKLHGLSTPGGASMVQTWQDELGVGVTDIARWLIFREVQSTIAVGVEPPDLKDNYALFRGLKFTVSIARQALSKGLGPGMLHAGLAELESLFAGLSDLLVWSMIVLEYAPPILGFMQGIYLSMLPVIILWALVPGTQGRPLALYFVWLGILYSSPIWWGLIELFTHTFSDVSPGFLSDPAGWVYTYGLRLLLHTFGVVVALIMGALATGLTGLTAAFAKLS